jgi:hypothetical protein
MKAEVFFLEAQSYRTETTLTHYKNTEISCLSLSQIYINEFNFSSTFFVTTDS